jgi:hypothetical protein
MPLPHHVPHQPPHAAPQEQQRRQSGIPEELNGDRGYTAAPGMYDGVRRDAVWDATAPARDGPGSYVNGKPMFVVDGRSVAGDDRQQANGTGQYNMNHGSAQAHDGAYPPSATPGSQGVYASEGARRASVGVLIPSADKALMARRDPKMLDGIQQTAQDWQMAAQTQRRADGDAGGTDPRSVQQSSERQRRNSVDIQRGGSGEQRRNMDVQERGWQDAEIKDLDDLSAVLMREASLLNQKLQKVSLSLSLSLSLGLSVFHACEHVRGAPRFVPCAKAKSLMPVKSCTSCFGSNSQVHEWWFP